ncbi:hypothetical protein [Caballeronia sp. GAWG1-5s-s]|uniref:hypothetical protein n=1 Tax=Caballeronia sp. GAWG1-5s-s TaxID=2921743 RepID=UPI0020293EF9|nr:hypothetical protein [Caballeronia sp. GAWG1-5s-s]
MKNQSCLPYRGYTIDVRVVSSKAPSLDGQEVRYAVSWSILSFDSDAAPIVSLPEQLNFLTPDEGFRYAERQAKRFIDGCVNNANVGADPA